MKIIEKREYYSRTTSGKSWKSKPYKTEIEEINERYYNNVVDSMKWFNSGFYGQSCRGYKNYTCHGYVYTRIITVSPFKETKEIRTYKFF